MNRVVNLVLRIIDFDHVADRERERKYREIDHAVEEVVEEHEKTIVTAMGELNKNKPLSLIK